ncbi:MAG: FKBP-type peptidyl-prolyl cis-trans isomerase [Gemmatimonadota bacterium]|nr:FKBP-type peptidyl-prolyl cis-trans isomerase [Gemmatimonadota bacterium]
MRIAALLLVALAACSSEPPKAPAAAPPAAATPAEDLTKIDTAIAPALGVELSKMTAKPSGLYLRDKKIGTGARADSGKWVQVEYTGWLANGKKFDSSRDRHEPLKFPIGFNRVIRGWDEGVQGMRVGGRRLLIVPPELGYGKAGQPGTIPSRATLVFDIELVKVF